MHLGAEGGERNVVLTSFCAEGIFMWLLLIWLIGGSACTIVLLTNCCRSKGETKSQTEYEYMDWKALEEARVRLRSQYAVQTLKRRPAHTLRRCVSDSDLSMHSCDDLIAPPAPPLPPGPLFANNRTDLNRRSGFKRSESFKRKDLSQFSEKDRKNRRSRRLLSTNA